MRTMTRLGRRQRRGSAALEFGFWFPLLMVMLSGIIDLSWYMSLRENVAGAARDGARSGAAAGGDVVAGEAVGQQVLDGVGYSCPSAMSGSVDGVTIGGEGFSRIEMSASCTFTPLIGLLPILTSTPAFTNVDSRFIMLVEP